VQHAWPSSNFFEDRGIYLSCGDSRDTGLAEQSIDLVVTDPPFFDNVHYSELADFFRAWQRPDTNEDGITTTRAPGEVQDTDATKFASKLQFVFQECRRVLKDDGLLVFTYHHSRSTGWQSLADAILGAGFHVVNSQPVKGEMSVAAPKSQAKEPVQIDVIIVCRKYERSTPMRKPSIQEAIETGKDKIQRLVYDGFGLSRNDIKVILFGQLLTTITSAREIDQLVPSVEAELASLHLEAIPPKKEPTQQFLF
jgi:putative DNA methylase